MVLSKKVSGHTISSRTGLKLKKKTSTERMSKKKMSRKKMLRKKMLRENKNCSPERYSQLNEN